MAIVSLEDGIKVIVPQGASQQQLDITITKLLENEANQVIETEKLASSIYEVLKNDPNLFTKPVTITLAFDEKEVQAGQGVAVFYYDELKKEWVEIKDGKVNGKYITVEVNHFTKFSVLVVDAVTGLPVSTAVSPTAPAITLNDIAGHWAEESINRAVKLGFVNGYNDDTFKPNHTITRAEFTVMLAKALNLQGNEIELAFTDKSEIGAWAQPAIQQAVQARIINGYADGTFRPNAHITRAEMATMIAKALQLTNDQPSTTSFSDDQDIPSWAKGSVAVLTEKGIVSGSGANSFKPQALTTRAEAVVVIMNMLNAMNKSK